MFKKILPIFIIFSIPIFSQNSQLSMSGKVVNSSTNEPLENCNIYIKEIGKGTTTDNSGNYKLELEKGEYDLTFSYIGFKSQKHNIVLEDKKVLLNVTLNPISISGKEVKIIAEREPAPIIIQKIENEDIQKMPTIYSDVLKSVQVLSGVATNNELTSGYNVRGGTFDENIIYLNGYEIYRPFLLRLGIEENQSTINPNMVNELTFFNGAFTASYGDKMSSVLEADYKRNYSDRISGVIAASLTNAGINLNNRIGKFNWSLGLRYAYPSNFLSKLKTRGSYEPSFSDIQFLGIYNFSEYSTLEFLGIYADNKYQVSPTNWMGGFGYEQRGDYRGIKIESVGQRNYSYLNNLLGLQYRTALNERSKLKISFSKYWINEKEKYDLSSDIYYFPVAAEPDENLEFLKSRFEKGNNSVELDSYRIKAEFDTKIANHNISIGTEYRISEVTNYSYENYYETGDSLTFERSIDNTYQSFYNLDQFNFYVEDYILLHPFIEINLGLRYLRYNYSDENLFSPRAYIIYKLSEHNSFKFNWGYYYQPPFISELKSSQINNLKSQRSIHYVLGWERKIDEKSKYKLEIYYKDLYNLIPFYFDEYRMVYVENNNREGYAYGLDLMYEGNIMRNLKGRIGYSYLDTKERKMGTKNSYQRRLLDQTHTFQIFFQDSFRKHRNWQAHVRMLFGSGYLFYQRTFETDEKTGGSYIDVNLENPNDYFIFFRTDMGLSAKFDLGNNINISPTIEVINVFNQSNYSAYEWVHIFEDIQAPIGVPRLLSKRFFNLKVKVSF